MNVLLMKDLVKPKRSNESYNVEVLLVSPMNTGPIFDFSWTRNWRR